ncbi:hypothetical protein FBUS_09626 [Fasciolopsis buskii]|uniref:Cilia-and flagella-associated protein 96 n=1 Tax=Fasciolopsis buskii TaxID=27845 RepID=A0A8E0S4X9_9TREM|nr:hypothetical protein FBUS_09626 [Fasciolopsis buski]
MRPASSKPDLDRLGIFREMSYHTVSDPYNPVITFDRKVMKGRQMLVGGTKAKSALNDGYFDPFRRVFSGDCRVDVGSSIRRQRISAKKLNKGKDWIPTSCLKEIDGPGSCYGTFSGPIPYVKPTSNQIKPKITNLKNITTNYGKKGSGSYVDVCFSPYPKHHTDPYDRIDRINAKEAAIGRSLISKKGPFYHSVHPIPFFDPNPFRNPKLVRRPHSLPSKKFKAITPFKPSSPSKSDGGCKDGCFDKFPSYMSGAERKSKRQVNSAPVFRPSYGPLPYPISSIINQNVKRTMNSANRKTIKGVVYLQ